MIHNTDTYLINGYYKNNNWFFNGYKFKISIILLGISVI